jgi:membrane glycosyltransferase
MLLIPEEAIDSPLLEDTADEARLLPRLWVLSRFEEAIISHHINQMHRSFARPLRDSSRREALTELCQRCLERGPSALNRSEQSYLCRDQESLAWLHDAVWRASPDSYWGQRLAMVAAAQK